MPGCTYKAINLALTNQPIDEFENELGYWWGLDMATQFLTI